MFVKCPICNETVMYSLMNNHLDSGCNQYNVINKKNNKNKPIKRHQSDLGSFFNFEPPRKKMKMDNDVFICNDCIRIDDVLLSTQNISKGMIYQSLVIH